MYLRLVDEPFSLSPHDPVASPLRATEVPPRQPVGPRGRAQPGDRCAQPHQPAVPRQGCQGHRGRSRDVVSRPNAHRSPPVLRPCRAAAATSPCSTGSSTRSTTGAAASTAVNDHEADWEQVVVYLAERAEVPRLRRGSCSPPTTRPATTYAAAGTILTCTRVGDHPVVFAGLGSHSGAYLRGEYLTNFVRPRSRDSSA